VTKLGSLIRNLYIPQIELCSLYNWIWLYNLFVPFLVLAL